MAFLNSMNISGSALTAQKLRLDIISENIANSDTTRTPGGGPYARKTVVFEPIKNETFKSILSGEVSKSYQGGVKVSNIIVDETSFKTVYNPSHPDADERGYVNMPNVDTLKETVDTMSATRSYEANVTAFNAIKMMALKALEIGR